MKKMWGVGLLCAVVSVPAMAQDTKPIEGQMLYDSNMSRVAPIRKVMEDGSVQIILEGKLVTLPGNTLSLVDGKLKTTLTKNRVVILQ